MEDLVLFLFYVAGINFVLLVGCLVADYIFPHIPFIERYLESLPDWEDEECEEWYRPPRCKQKQSKFSAKSKQKASKSPAKP